MITIAFTRNRENDNGTLLTIGRSLLEIGMAWCGCDRRAPRRWLNPHGVSRCEHDRNAWRQGKALLQVAIPGDAHIELSVLAKRRRMPLSQLVKSALNLWLETHSHTLRITD